MCGSDLETNSAAATGDLQTIINSNYNKDNVNVVVMAGGSKDWKNDYMSDCQSDDSGDDMEKVAIYEVKPQERSQVDPNADITAETMKFLGIMEI